MDFQCALPFHPHVKRRVVACHCRLRTSAVPTPRVVFSLQYRSYLRPTDRWHYGSVDYLDPLLCTPLSSFSEFTCTHSLTPSRCLVSYCRLALALHRLLRLQSIPQSQFLAHKYQYPHYQGLYTLAISRCSLS